MAHTAPQNQATTNHARLLAWVEEIAALTQPDEVHWCDGSAEEYDRLAQGACRRRHLRAAVRCQAARTRTWRCPIPTTSRASRIARSSARRTRPTRARRTTGASRSEMRVALTELFEGSMRGRTMYVVPFCMGPLGSNISYIGVQLTDSAYVACSMRIMTRMGQPALDVLGDDGDFVPCLHSVGHAAGRAGRHPGRAVAVQRRQQVHRPLPRDARDLVLRLRLRRQRAARQEVLRAADRLGDGARRGLARRAHADPEAHLAGGRGQVRDAARSRARAARPTWRC